MSTEIWGGGQFHFSSILQTERHELMNVLTSSSVYRVYSSLSVIVILQAVQRDSQDKINVTALLLLLLPGIVQD